MKQPYPFGPIPFNTFLILLFVGILILAAILVAVLPNPFLLPIPDPTSTARWPTPKCDAWEGDNDFGPACVITVKPVPTQTARVVVRVVTATPEPLSTIDQHLAYCLQVSPMSVSDCMADFEIYTPVPVDTPVVCPMICPSYQHLAWCLGLQFDDGDDVAACLYQLSDLDRLATDTVNMNATEAWAGVPQEVPCADPPARHTPIHLISRTTVRGYPASFGPNLGQAEGGLVRPLVEARVSREDGNLWYHLLEIPTNDNPFGVSGWIRAAYADCLVPTATPEAP